MNGNVDITNYVLLTAWISVKDYRKYTVILSANAYCGAAFTRGYNDLIWHAGNNYINIYSFCFIFISCFYVNNIIIINSPASQNAATLCPHGKHTSTKGNWKYKCNYKGGVETSPVARSVGRRPVRQEQTAATHCT